MTQQYVKICIDCGKEKIFYSFGDYHKAIRNNPRCIECGNKNRRIQSDGIVTINNIEYLYSKSQKTEKIQSQLQGNEHIQLMDNNVYFIANVSQTKKRFYLKLRCTAKYSGQLPTSLLGAKAPSFFARRFLGLDSTSRQPKLRESCFPLLRIFMLAFTSLSLRYPHEHS